MLLNTPDAELGWKAKEFSLKDFDGKNYSLKDLKGEKGLVIAFICNHCPYVKAVIERLVRDAKEIKKIGVNFVAINSNDHESYPEDSPPMMKKFSTQHGFNFPYLVDDHQIVGKEYGAVCTPDFFGFNSQGELQYRGRLDDARMGSGENRVAELVEAMKEVASKGSTSVKQLPSMGCSIKWK